MARIRTIKPEFFTSDDICSLTMPARLLYIGIWCEADKEGRLEWSPRNLKRRYLPDDSVDIEALCSELLDRGLVVPYGDDLAYIPKFSKHQHINPRESASKLPDPDACPTRHPRVPDVSSTRKQRDSDAQVGREGKGREGKELTTPDGVVVASKPATPDCPHSEIVAAYHDILPTLRRVREWTPDRQAFLRARWREKPERQSLAWWRGFFEYVAGCPLLMGEVPGRDGGAPFSADLEWLVRPTNFRKVIEGKYQRRAA